MKSMSFILCFIFMFLFLSCKEAPQEYSQNYSDDPTNPSIQPRVVGVWLDSPRPYWWRKTGGLGKQNDSLPIGYRPERLLVRFNKIMLSYTVIPNINLTPEEVGFALLSTRGGFSLDGQTFEWPVSGNFKLGKSYTITVKKEVTDITNLHLSQDYKHSIIPEQFLRITYTYPADGDSNVYSGYFYTVFNSVIDVHSLSSGVQFVPPVEGRWVSYGNNYVEFLPHLGFKGNTWYEVVFSQAVKDTFNNYLKHRFKIKFKTVRFQLSYTYPYNGEQNVNRNSSVCCNFTTSLDTSTIRQNFNMTPAVSGTFNYYSNNIGYCFNPTGGLDQNTTYTVTISTGLRSKTGDNLSSPYVFSFTTGSN
ncbi:MAG: Ig-like domain-containing protein [Bacteroidota bacterium]|nr:Ig-like domain-containing protein [Bacteroidota bacterium]